MQPELTSKETRQEKRREAILNGNLWKTIGVLTIPLAIFSLFNYLYGFIDIILVAHIDTSYVSSVIFIDEIRNAINAFGTALAAAGCVVVARHYGAGRTEEARKNAGTTFIMTIVISVIVVAFMLVLAIPILTLAGATDEIIYAGLGYYNVQMITTALVAINAVFIGLEKAKGNTSIVLWLNIIAMAIKLILSLIFVFAMDGDIMLLAISTLISQGVLTIIAIAIMFSKKNILKIGLADFKLSWSYIKPILILAIPIFIGRFMFNIGKVSINGFVLQYSQFAVGALGIAFRLHGVFSSTARVFEESGMLVVSQNLGNRRLDRALKTFFVCIAYCLIIAGLGFAINPFLRHVFMPLLTDDPDEISMIITIFRWEHFSMLTSSVVAIISGFFIAFKKTRITMVFNLFRIFVFRVPVLWIFTLIFPVGPENVRMIGITMFISNTATFVIAVGCVWYFINKLRNYGYEGMLLDDCQKKVTETIQ